MHTFDYIESPKKLLTPDAVRLLTTLHEFRGKQGLYMKVKPDVLFSLLEVAKIQSTKASNQIEGIYTSDDRMAALVREKAEPRNRSEQEIAGYRDVLATIHENYEYINITPNNILQLHRDLYSYRGGEQGGHWKNTDNVIAERTADGEQRVRFQPVPAFQTEDAVRELSDRFNDALKREDADALILIPMFILDFLCIHPFNDGNGRMSRLLTLLLLYRSGYMVGKYISVEMLIEASKATYYESLHASSVGWHENESDYMPFILYYLGVIKKAYSSFRDRVEHLCGDGFVSKTERIRDVFNQKLGKITKKDIMELCPDIAKVTVDRAIQQLQAEGFIEKVGKARASGYVKK